MQRNLLRMLACLAGFGQNVRAEEPPPPHNYIGRLNVLPTPPTEMPTVDRLIKIPELPANDPHHAVMTAVRATMTQACITCHSTPQKSKQTDILGFVLEPADATLREQLRIEKGGLVVTAIRPDSPAAKAGIVKNDILLSAQKSLLSTDGDLKEALGKSQDKALELTWVHEGTRKAGSIARTIAPGIAISYGFPKDQPPPEIGPFWIGVSIHPASEPLRSQLKLADGVGLVVDEVIKEGPAAKAGLKTNDVLIVADEVPLGTPKDLRDVVNKVKDERSLHLSYYRALFKNSTEIKPEKRKVETTMDISGYDPLWNVANGQPPVIYRVVPDASFRFTPTETQKLASTYLNVNSIAPGLQSMKTELSTLPQNNEKLDQIDRQLKELAEQIKALKQLIESQKELPKAQP